MEIGRTVRLSIAVAVLLGAAGYSFGLEESNVLVLYNTDSQAGGEIVGYYSQRRSDVHTFGLNLGEVGEQISADSYLMNISGPVYQELMRLGSSGTRIDCIVTTKGMPLRIHNPSPEGYQWWEPYSSLESELTRIDSIRYLGEQDDYDVDHYKELMGDHMPVEWGGNGLFENPYFRANEPFNADEQGVRLTSRLDGFSVADVKRSIRYAERAETRRDGFAFLLDDDPNLTRDRMELLRDNVLIPEELEHIYDGTTAFKTNLDEPGAVLGYVSHGVHGTETPSGYLKADGPLKIEAAPGAVFHSYESFNAYSFEPGGNHYGQALVAEWIERGGTAGLGHVEEPGVGSRAADEDHLFRLLLEGFSFVEAAWMATREVSFVHTVVGDPLMLWDQEDWLVGDANLDGALDIHDIAAVKNAYGTFFGDDGYSFLADLNGDGVVGAADMNIVKSAFLNASGSSATTIPEPAVLTVIAAGGLALVQRRRSR